MIILRYVYIILYYIYIIYRSHPRAWTLWRLWCVGLVPTRTHTRICSWSTSGTKEEALRTSQTWKKSRAWLTCHLVHLSYLYCRSRVRSMAAHLGSYPPRTQSTCTSWTYQRSTGQWPDSPSTSIHCTRTSGRMNKKMNVVWLKWVQSYI